MKYLSSIKVSPVIYPAISKHTENFPNSEIFLMKF